MQKIAYKLVHLRFTSLPNENWRECLCLKPFLRNTLSLRFVGLIVKNNKKIQNKKEIIVVTIPKFFIFLQIISKFAHQAIFCLYALNRNNCSLTSRTYSVVVRGVKTTLIPNDQSPKSIFFPIHKVNILLQMKCLVHRGV